MTKEALKDAAERLGWTILQVVISAVVVVLADIPAWWAVPIAGVLSGAKSFVGSKIGDDTNVAFV